MSDRQASAVRRMTLACGFLLAAAWPLAAPCGEPDARDSAIDSDQAGTDRVTYVSIVRPLLEEKCFRCHGGDSRKADLDLTSYAGLMKGGESGPAVEPGSPETSLLFRKIQAGEMPPEQEPQLSVDEVDAVRRWIASGAAAGDETASSEAAITDQDVVPILLLRCAVCHGLRRQEAGLDLRTKASMLQGGKSGAAIVLGNPDESLLVQRIRAGEMPPKKSLLDAGVKPVTAGELDQLVHWIGNGAPEAAALPDLAGTPQDPLIGDEDRQFWAFQPPASAGVPRVKQLDQVRNPVDAFLLSRLEAHGLTFSPEADRLTLLRRATYDLTGLPPEPADAETFLRDDSSDAYEKLIDRLLASPRYGERWGRYWLDAAGYADSEGGKLDADHPRPHAWRYRDYVIRSLNDDKPYDRFLLEQLAGDELADYERAPEITQELYDNLVATGFLRMAPDSTSEREVAFTVDRFDVIADEIDVFSTTVLGLTVRCARCHSHKYDPLPQRDYYRLAAMLKGAYDEHDWLKPRSGSERQYTFPVRELPYVTSAERQQWIAERDAVQGHIDQLRRTLAEHEQRLRQDRLTARLAALPEILHDDLRRMLATAPDARDDVLKYLAEKFESELTISRDELLQDEDFKAAADNAERQTKDLQARLPPEPMIQALWDRGAPSPAFLYQRGDVENAGIPISPGVPAVLGNSPPAVEPPWPGAKQTGRRLALARWVVRPDHPLTARVMVNRVWSHHFGTGLVKTPGNFGHTGARPTHPQLLDWLAIEFVRHGWRLKPLHRLLMTARAYRQSSLVTPSMEHSDPDDSLLSRMPLRRLDAEALRDTLLLASGRLNEARYGPSDAVTVNDEGLVTVAPVGGGWRRSIYVRQRRKEIPTILETFDLPQMAPNCLERPESTVAPQALHLLNNAEVRELAASFAERVERETSSDLANQVRLVYKLALSREPTAEELTIGMEALQDLRLEWERAQPPMDRPPASRALSDYCHTILNSAALLYVD